MTESIYPSLSPGAEIAGYRIESPLGRGGMAVVFRARDLRLDRPVGLKVLAPELSESPQFRERFLRESRLAASLDHPNIIPVYEAGEDHGLLFIAMRLVGGGDLAERLRRQGRLSPEHTVGIVAQVAAALDAAHEAGLVHRDVKPGNILVVPGVAGQHRDHVYLSDFGLTKRVTSLSGVTAQGQFIATMDYAAPEQIGSRPVDARTDVYGLGCVAYQCLTGTVPFVRDNEAALLWAHLVERPPPVSAHRSELAPFDAAIAQALEKNPEDRFASCGQFVDALAAAAPHRHQSTPAATPAAGTLGRPGHPHPGGRTRSRPRHPHPGDPGPAHPDEPPPGQHRRTARGASPPEHPATAAGGAPLAAPTSTRKIGRAARTPHPAASPTHRAARAARAASGRRRDATYRPPRLAAAGRDGGALVGWPPWSPPWSSLPAQASSSHRTSAAAAPAAPPSRPRPSNAEPPTPPPTRHCPRVTTWRPNSGCHAGIMKMGGASSIVAGRPALTAGAAAAAVYQDRAAGYKPLAAECAKNDAATPACKARIAVADQAVGHADNVVNALMQHTAIMNQWDSGQLTAEQAHMQGKPSQDAGLAEANALDQSVHDYQQQAGNC